MIRVRYNDRYGPLDGMGKHALYEDFPVHDYSLPGDGSIELVNEENNVVGTINVGVWTGVFDLDLIKKGKA